MHVFLLLFVFGRQSLLRASFSRHVVSRSSVVLGSGTAFVCLRSHYHASFWTCVQRAPRLHPAFYFTPFELTLLGPFLFWICALYSRKWNPASEPPRGPPELYLGKERAAFRSGVLRRGTGLPPRESPSSKPQNLLRRCPDP